MEVKDQFILLAVKLLGIPYVWGGSTPDTGLDCSGLMVWLLLQTGLVPAGYDNTAQGLYKKYGKEKEIESGDFIFYGRSPSEITHVMLALNSEYCIGATNGNHTTTSKEIAAEQDAAIKVKPINYRKDFVAVGSV